MYLHFSSIQPSSAAAPPSIKPIATAKQAISTASGEQHPPEPVQEVQEDQESVGRDSGVMDAVWMQVQADKASAIEAQKQREEAERRAKK